MLLTNNKELTLLDVAELLTMPRFISDDNCFQNNDYDMFPDDMDVGLTSEISTTVGDDVDEGLTKYDHNDASSSHISSCQQTTLTLAGGLEDMYVNTPVGGMYGTDNDTYNYVIIISNSDDVAVNDVVAYEAVESSTSTVSNASTESIIRVENCDEAPSDDVNALLDAHVAMAATSFDPAMTDLDEETRALFNKFMSVGSEVETTPAPTSALHSTKGVVVADSTSAVRGRSRATTISQSTTSTFDYESDDSTLSAWSDSEMDAEQMISSASGVSRLTGFTGLLQPVQMADIEDDALLQAAMTAAHTGTIMPLVKEELKYTIQAKRLKMGVDESTVIPERNAKFECDQWNTEDEERRRKRRELNRLAAQKCRGKRRARMSQLKQQADNLTTKNETLTDEINLLNKELYQLKQMILSHDLYAGSACADRLSTHARGRIQTGKA